MNDETGRLLRAFRTAREKMENAAAQNELTEALCLLPPAQRAFACSMAAFRERMSALPEPGVEGAGPKPKPLEPLEFPPLDDGRPVSAKIVVWFSLGVVLALIASFVLGFVAAQSGW